MTDEQLIKEFTRWIKAGKHKVRIKNKKGKDLASNEAVLEVVNILIEILENK